MLKQLRKLLSQGAIWSPDLDKELLGIQKIGLLKGTVLNAGCVWRDISNLIEGKLINQDLAYENEERTSVDIYSPLHQIPLESNSVDTILCIAVLEHVENPEEILPEFFRVLKPGGHLVASVSFLQPEHKIPTDFQRYTEDGLSRLMTYHHFTVINLQPLFTVYHTLHWIVWEWLHLKNSIVYKILRVCLLPPLVFLAQKSELKSAKLSSGFQVIAQKPL